MTTIFNIDGLSLPESLMLYLGVFLALIGFAGIITCMVRSKPLSNYLYVVALAIIMMGWSGIKKVSFGKDILNIETKTEELMKQPDNNTLSTELAKEVENIASSSVVSSKGLVILAKAYTVLGNTNKGSVLANKALIADPENTEAKQVKILAETNQLINSLILNPDNSKTRQSLTGNIEQLENQPEINTYKTQIILDANLLLAKPEKEII